MLAGFLPKIATLLTQPVGQAVAAGLLTGVIGGSVGVATGAIPVGGPTGGNLTALFACPGSGSVVTSIAPGSDVLVIARSADGAWLELYVGEPGVASAWAPARALQLEAAPDTLPIGDCVAPATPGPTVEPQSSASSAAPSAVPSASAPPSVGPSPSPSPVPSATPKPSPTPAPTAAPTSSPGPVEWPILTELTLQDIPPDPFTGVYYLYPYGCSGEYNAAPFTVRANDPDGVEMVRLYFQPTGGSVSSVLMDWEGGPEGDLFYGSFSSDGSWGEGPVTYWLEAEDGIGNVSPKFYGDAVVELVYCAD